MIHKSVKVMLFLIFFVSFFSTELAEGFAVTDETRTSAIHRRGNIFRWGKRTAPLDSDSPADLDIEPVEDNDDLVNYTDELPATAEEMNTRQSQEDEDKTKRGTVFRFGKRGSVFRFGKKRGTVFRFGKKRGTVFRFGKKRGTVFRFGKKRGSVFRFGKKRGTVFRFGKKRGSVFRFGKKRGSVFRFGKRARNVFRFGKRDPNAFDASAVAEDELENLKD